MSRNAASRPRPGLALALALTLSLGAGPALARTVTGMDGRIVVVPDQPKRVYALSPPDTLLVYALAPCLLAGWNASLPEDPAGLRLPCTRDLPVLGGFFGQDAVPDREALARVAPDLVVSGTMARPWADFETQFTEAGIPVLPIESGRLEDYPQALRLLGEALDRKERGEALAAYAEETLAVIRRELAAIPPEKRLTVYYAEGDDGLCTDGRDSLHTQVLELAGGTNVHLAPQTRLCGMDRISLDTLRGYAPQVILVRDPACRARILASPGWAGIPAVKNGRVLLVPAQPFDWFDRPPSFMRLLGLKWLANALYPQVFPFDMVEETRAFFELFLERAITESQARALLEQRDVPKP